MVVGAASAQDTPHRMALKLDALDLTVNRHLFGPLVEHFGRGVYG